MIIQKGTLVDFGSYGKLYVVADHTDTLFWVTDDKSERYNSHARGWNIRKSAAKGVIEEGKSNESFYLLDEEEEDRINTRRLPAFLRGT